MNVLTAPLHQVGFFQHCFLTCPGFDVFSLSATLWSLLVWAMGTAGLGQGVAGLSAVARRGHGQKKAGVDFRETSLALLLMFQLANQFLSKSFFSLLLKKILAIFFSSFSFVAYIFHIARDLRVMP